MTSYVYFIAPTRRRHGRRLVWRLVRVYEHGRYHDERPRTWRGPYPTKNSAQLAAWMAEREGTYQ